VIADDVQARVARAVVPSDVTAHGDAHRMEIVVVSVAFDGVSRVRRQQLVYAAIAELIATGALHAVTIRASTPAERAAESQSESQ
jgi:acid stress-induced BolA-like protein IbaG/YrbA